MDTVRAGLRTARVVARRGGVVAGVEPVATPLPDVPGRVVEPVAVGRESIDRRCSGVAVLACVLAREAPLKHIHAVLSARFALVAPREAPPVQPAAGRVLPL